MLEVFWIALVVGLTRSIFLTWGWMQPRPWVYTIPAAIAVTPIAVGGLFGHMRLGAHIEIPACVLYIVVTLLRGFPADYDTHW